MTQNRGVFAIAAGALLVSALSVGEARPAAAATDDTVFSVVSLAESQLYQDSSKGYGPCGASGAGYYAADTGQSGSCSDGGEAHSWCADFAGWVWQQAGVADMDGELNDLAESFYDYGLSHGTTSSSPAVGDVVYYHPESESLTYTGDDHVAVVVAVNSDGTIDTVGGDEGDGNVQEDYEMPGQIGTGVWTGDDGAEVDVFSFIAPVGGDSG